VTRATQSKVATDEHWMARALVLAARAKGQTRPNPPVGSVILDENGDKVGEGYHRKAGSAHAEIAALSRAGDKARGGTLYVTLEPCSTEGRTGACTTAIIAAGVRRVVVATRDPNPVHRGRGLRLLRSAGVKVTSGICRQQADELIRGFETWMTSGRPFITLKLGLTLDGYIADNQGRSKWITSAQSRRIVQRMRTEADAVMVGGATARIDNPSLLCAQRKAGGPPLLRVIIDDVGALPPASQVLCDGCACQTIIATTERCAPLRRAQYERKGATVWTLRAVKEGVSLKQLMRKLGEVGVLEILCEGGGELAASLTRAGLVDRYVLFYAPAILGGDARPAFGGRRWSLGSMPSLKIESMTQVGPDMMVSALPKGKR
jgi:diaminohydroxyphosphoribosylaminopyrimidine deaminase/5-amino-6-(5-phosphoribosylamino)uracil reductase